MGDDLISKLFDAKDKVTKEKDNIIKNDIPNDDVCGDADDDNDNDDGDESGEEVNVIEFEYDGVTYYRDDDGIVYKNMDGDEVGEWDEKTSTIKFNEE